MSIDSVTSYNPNNVNDTLYAYQSNRTVGTNPIQQVPKTNYTSSVSLDTSPDTFELSAESKIKNNKDKGMSAGLKALLWIGGTTAAVYGAVVGHRALTKPSIEKVAKNFSEIFRRDVSKEEAQKLVNNYIELLNIEDTEEFVKKAFEQVKKDYGYEKTPIELKINKIKDYLGSADAGWCSENGELSINLLIDNSGKVCNKNKRGRKCILQTLLHEFQHTKQDEFAYRTSRDDIVKAILNRKRDQSVIINNIKNILSKKSKLEIEAKKLNISVEECKKRYEELLKELEQGKYDFSKIKFDKNTQIALDNIFKDYKKFPENSEEYKLGLKYIENNNNYIQAGIDRNGYEKQILEAEAFGVEDKFKEIYNSFANIWRIPFFQ